MAQFSSGAVVVFSRVPAIRMKRAKLLFRTNCSFLYIFHCASAQDSVPNSNTSHANHLIPSDCVRHDLVFQLTFRSNRKAGGEGGSAQRPRMVCDCVCVAVCSCACVVVCVCAWMGGWVCMYFPINYCSICIFKCNFITVYILG